MGRKACWPRRSPLSGRNRTRYSKGFRFSAKQCKRRGRPEGIKPDVLLFKSQALKDFAPTTARRLHLAVFLRSLRSLLFPSAAAIRLIRVSARAFAVRMGAARQLTE